MSADASPVGWSPGAANGTSPPAPAPTSKPSPSRTANAASFVTDSAFCAHFPACKPSEFRTVRPTIAQRPIPTGARGWVRWSIGASVEPKLEASAAIDPGNPIQKLVHPLRKPKAGPYASRKYTYSPPDRGKRPPSSPLVSAPASATAPPSSQAPRNAAGDL